MKIRLVIAIVTLLSLQIFAQNMQVLVDHVDFGYDVAQFSEGLLRAKQHDKWGFMNEDGQWAIQPRFSEAYDFSEGLAAVKIGNKYGYINRSGKLVISARYSYATKFSEGLAQVGFVKGKNGYIDYNENIIFVSNEKFKCVKDEPSADGMIKVIGSNKKYGYVDQSGNMVVSPQFDRAYTFIDGIAAVAIGRKVGFINQGGSFCIQPKYDVIKRFENGYTGVCLGDRWGIIQNSRQSEIVRPRYVDVQSFHKGLAAVQVNDKWGFINQYGDMVISPRFCEAAPFNGNLTPVCINDKWGYIDANGNIAINPQYKNPNRKVNAFVNGMEIAFVGNKCGVINEQGQFIIAPNYDCIYFSGETPGLAIAMKVIGGERNYSLVRIYK